MERGWSSPMKARMGVQDGRGPALVDLVDDPLHLLAVGQVLGQPLPGRIDEGAEDHALAPLRVAVEQVVVGQESSHQVLGQLDAVDSGDQRTVPDLLVQRGQRLGAGGSPGHPGQVLGIRRQRRHEGPGLVAQPQATVGGEGLGPAGCVESAGVVSGQPFEQLHGHGVGQHPEPVGPGERGVGEVDRDQVGSSLGQHRPQQAQVVVLHQHHRVRGRLGRDGLGEGLVDPSEGVPGPGEVPVEAGSAGQLPQAVVQEPERGVAHHVIGHAVVLGIEGQQGGVQPLGLGATRARRPPVALGHGRGHPQGVGADHERGQPRHQAAGAPSGHQLVVRAQP